MHLSDFVKKDHRIWVLPLVIVLVFCSILMVNYKTKLNSAEQNILRLENENKSLIEHKTTLSKEVENLQSQLDERDKLIESFPHLNEIMISEMKESGFNGDENAIKDDLVKHDELIPYDGVLGGTMGFYSRDNIYVLSNKWVLAYFEDGHIYGYMLLSYKYSNNGITWKVFDSYLL